ncbi:MAG TPA: response regulator [Puia sp.]|nr:response regulator [Puia sp.]
MRNKEASALVVDNDVKNIRELTKILYNTRLFEMVFQALNYSEAVFILRKRNIHLLLIEILLPGRNGIELLRTIRDSRYNAETIMLYGQPNNYYRNLCISLGASCFFEKTENLNKIGDIATQLILNQKNI